MKQKLFYSCHRDDCSRKVVVSKWCNRRNSEKAILLSVLKEWIELYGKPMKVMHDGSGREFTSTTFKNYLILNGIKRTSNIQRLSTRTGG
jgi:hypothetical protein